MKASVLLVIVIVVLLIWWFAYGGCGREGLSGYGVVSGLAFNDRLAYCDPGYGYPGASYSGACTLPHKVII